MSTGSAANVSPRLDVHGRRSEWAPLARLISEASPARPGKVGRQADSEKGKLACIAGGRGGEQGVSPFGQGGGVKLEAVVIFNGVLTQNFKAEISMLEAFLSLEMSPSKF